MSDLRPILLVTRPESQGRAFAHQFRSRFGADWPVLFAPVMGIELLRPPAAEIARADAAAAVVFSSANAVEGFAALSPARGRVAWCVGAATARAAQAAGFGVRVAKGDAASLLRLITQEAPHGPLIHARGRHVAAPLAQALRQAGHGCDEITVYDQREQPLTGAALAALAGGRALLVPVFSPRSARLLAPALAQARAPLRVVAISAAAAGALGGLPARVAAQPSAAAMLTALEAELAR